MKKPYQIEAQRAVNRLAEMAAEENRRADGIAHGRDQPNSFERFRLLSVVCVCFSLLRVVASNRSGRF